MCRFYVSDLHRIAPQHPSVAQRTFRTGGTTRRMERSRPRRMSSLSRSRSNTTTPSVTITEPVLPARIGKYRVLKRLGEGATSEVFLARDDFHERDVAIKRLRNDSLVDAHEGHYFERFFAAEAALVGRLHHPNVVQIYDAVADPAEPYLVMEYVGGVTLRRYCRPDQLLSLELIVEIGFKCAMALGYVYRQGLIHRDIKPANLLVVRDRGNIITDVKVTDFGSVLNLQADTTQIFRVGSLAYMSPEQLDGGTLDAAPTSIRSVR